MTREKLTRDIIHKTIEDYVCNKETDTAKAQGMLNALRIMDEVLEQEPTGHWINDEDTIGVYYCSKCGGYVASYDDSYCKYCGARMVEPQERSDKE